MQRLPLFIEAVHNAQHSNVLVCRKIMAELFKQKISPLPFAASIKEANDVLAAMKMRGTKPSIVIVNTFEAESLLTELDPILGNTPTLFFLRQIFSETTVMMNAAFGNVPHDSIGTILQKMKPRPNSVWTYGSKTAEAVAQKAAKSMVEFLKDGDFFHIERHSQLQAQLMQMLKSASSNVGGVTVPASSLPAAAPRPASAAIPAPPPPPPPAPLGPETSRSSGRLRAASVTTAIHGFIEQLGVSSILMMFEMEKKSGELALFRRSESARLLLKGGRIVRASVDGLTVPLDSQNGVEAVYYVLTWTDGSFDFMPRTIDNDDEIKTPVTQFLMEAARRSDEPANQR